METTIVIYWGYIGIMENEMETTFGLGVQVVERMDKWNLLYRVR